MGLAYKICCWLRNARVNPDMSYEAGNPRNKHALEPGHSLMDWVRLTNSGKDLTGLGPEAGKLQVTLAELKKHNKTSDCWVVIRGNVFNVSAYLAFHPGGRDELMRGAGKDATKLFDGVHPWVNYQQMLSKCYVGKLIQDTSTSDDLPTRDIAGSSSQMITPVLSAVGPQAVESSAPRTDWMQKTDTVSLFFYTASYANPAVTYTPPGHDNIAKIKIRYNDVTHMFNVLLGGQVADPTHIFVNHETGKVDLVFKKAHEGMWQKVSFDSLGTDAGINSQVDLGDYKLLRKNAVSPDVCLLKFVRDDAVQKSTPIGFHFRVVAKIAGEEVSRFYTTVNCALFTDLRTNATKDGNTATCFMIKRYDLGRVSRHLCNLEPGSDLVSIHGPYGDFELKRLSKHTQAVLLAAGSGITPMVNIITFLLHRRIVKTTKVTLMFFNKNETDILFKNQFDRIVQNDKRFHVDYVLTRPSANWQGLKGRISTELLTPVLDRHAGTAETKNYNDIMFMLCGPTGFTEGGSALLQDMGVPEELIHEFRG